MVSFILLEHLFYISIVKDKKPATSACKSFLFLTKNYSLYLCFNHRIV